MNTLVGFVDGVIIGISVREQIQLSMQQLLKKLMTNKIKYADAMNEIHEIFKDIPKEENITEEYKDSWIMALEDFKPDSEPDSESKSKSKSESESESESENESETEFLLK